MSFGKTSGSSKPVFFGAQSDNADQAINEILLPRLFGGAPDVATEASQARTQEGLNEGLARQGLTGSGLAAKAISNQAVGAGQARDAQLLDLLTRLLTPVRNKSSSQGINLGLS